MDDDEDSGSLHSGHFPRPRPRRRYQEDNMRASPLVLRATREHEFRSGEHRSRGADRSSNQWTRKLEIVAHNLIMQAEYKAWIYEIMAAQAKKWGEWLTIAGAVLSAFITVESLFSVSSEGDSDQSESEPGWLRILVFVLSTISTCVLTLNTVWKPADISSKSRSAWSKLLQLKRNLTLQLAREREERSEGGDYMQTVVDELNAILLEAPVPYINIVKKAELRFGLNWDPDYHDPPHLGGYSAYGDPVPISDHYGSPSHRRTLAEERNESREARSPLYACMAVDERAAAPPPDDRNWERAGSDTETVQERRRLESDDDDEPFSGNPLLVFELPVEDSGDEDEDELSEEQIAFILDNIDEDRYVTRG